MKVLFFTPYYYLVGILDTLATSTAIILTKIFVWNKITKKKLVFAQLIPGWARRMVSHTGTQVSLEGVENIDPQDHYLVLVNHQSNFDIHLILGYLPLPLAFISKRFYFKIPFIGGLMNEMHCISVKRSSPKESLLSMELAAKEYDRGTSIIIYPEGTRSKDGEIKPFKRGFVHIIEKTATEPKLLPITLSGTRNIQTKGEIKINPSKVKITISPPITLQVGPLSLEAKNQLVEKIETTIKKPYQPHLD